MVRNWKKKSALLLKLFCLCVMLIWGFCIGKYSVFPYDIMLKTRNYLFPGSGDSEPQSWRFKVDHFSTLDSKADYVLVGDSITNYAEWSELIPGFRIANRGISGDTTKGVLKRMDQIIAMNPAVVYIMLGVNDVLHSYNDDEIQSNYKEIIDHLRLAQIKVVLVSTVHVRFENDEKFNDSISRLNHYLKSYVVGKTEVLYIDLNKSLSEGNRLKLKYSEDGIHLKADAYLVWAKYLKEDMVLSMSGNTNGS